MDVSKILKELAEAPGPSGFEEPVARVVKKIWEPFVDYVTIDRVGSLLAVKKGTGEESRPKLLLAAHMDEIALMVKQIITFPDDVDGNGFIKVARVGGVDIRHLYDQVVVVHGRVGDPVDLTGVIGALPHYMLPPDRRNKPYNLDELVVDVGMPARQLQEVVTVGDFITFRQPTRKLLNKRLTGKAFDNRSSVASVAVCLEYLHERKHVWDVVAVATAQEETALLGAYTSAYAQAPDAAIAIDVTFGKGPGANDELTYELAGGPTVSFGPNVHPGMVKGLKEAASALEMKIQLEPHSRPGGTDAYGLQVAREGVPTGLVGIPLRYMHTMVETLATADIDRAGRLLGEFIARLDGQFLSQLATNMMED
jgi:endoglucanase